MTANAMDDFAPELSEEIIELLDKAEQSDLEPEIIEVDQSVQPNYQTHTIERDYKYYISKFWHHIILLGILLFEASVWMLGKKYFISMEYSEFVASVLSFNIEAAYLYSASQRGLSFKVLAILLLAISINCLQYSAFSTDKNIPIYKDGIERELTQYKRELKEEASAIRIEEASIQEQMKVYLKHDQVSKGIERLKKSREAVRKRKDEYLERSDLLNSKIGKLEEKKRSISIVSSFGMLEEKTKVTIITFIVLQIGICIILPSLMDRIKGEA